MQVVAFSTPVHPEWRWRIVNYAGEVVGSPAGRSARCRSGRRGDGAARATERCRSLRSAPRISLNLASPRQIILPGDRARANFVGCFSPVFCNSPLTRRGTRRAFSLTAGTPVLGARAGCSRGDVVTGLSASRLRKPSSALACRADASKQR